MGESFQYYNPEFRFLRLTLERRPHNAPVIEFTAPPRTGMAGIMTFHFSDS